MLLAEELALVTINPSSGRHGLGLRSEINACLAEITELLWEANDPDAAPVVLGCVLAPVGKREA